VLALKKDALLCARPFVYAGKGPIGVVAVLRDL